MIFALNRLTPGMRVPFGGDKAVEVSHELAVSFEPGDRLVVVQESGDLLRVPRAVSACAIKARSIGHRRRSMGLPRCPTRAISDFFERFALKLAERGSGAKSKTRTLSMSRRRSRGGDRPPVWPSPTACVAIWSPGSAPGGTNRLGAASWLSVWSTKAGWWSKSPRRSAL